MQVAGRLFERAVGRAASLRIVGVSAMALAVAALAGLAAAKGPLATATAVLAYGAANGMLTIVRGAAPAELFGTRAYASAAGIVATANAAAAAIGPLAVTWFWAASGGYAVALLALAAVASVALGAFAVATRPVLSANAKRAASARWWRTARAAPARSG
jgi:MFS family permease